MRVAFTGLSKHQIEYETTHTYLEESWTTSSGAGTKNTNVYKYIMITQIIKCISSRSVRNC